MVSRERYAHVGQHLSASATFIAVYPHQILTMDPLISAATDEKRYELHVVFDHGFQKRSQRICYLFEGIYHILMRCQT